MKSPLIKFGNDVKPAIVSNQIIEGIKQGDLDPLHVAISFKRIQKIMDTVKNDKEIKDAITEETLKHTTGKEKIPAFGAMIEYAPTHTKYDYRSCENPELEAYNRIITICKARVKEIEKEMQNIPENGREIVIEREPMMQMRASGEIVKVFPPTKSQSFGTKIFV